MLSYQDRLDRIRETKIAHTLAKKEQNGYMDADDYGTVPLPDDYCVKPWFNRPCGAFFGLDGMSENFCRVLNAHPAYVDPLEVLCGRWRDMLGNYRGDIKSLPLWMQKNEELVAYLRDAQKEPGNKGWDEQRFPYDDLKPLQQKYNLTSGIESDAHFACDYSIGLTLGFGGLLQKIEHYRSVNPDKKDFYDAEEKCLRAIIAFVDRHIAEIDRQLETEARPEIRETLQKMGEACRQVRLGAPRTFWEACQWIAFFNCASRVYTRDGAGFQLDTLLLPYYEKDVADGILNDDLATFLLADLLLIDPHYYQISGVDENDCDMTNHLSYLVLEAADRINISCNVTVRVHENCDPAFLYKAVYYLFKNKNGWPRFCGDKTLCEGYMRNGIDKATARKRIAVGCHWMAVPGREFPMNDTVKVNIAKVMEVALQEMRGGECSTERLFTLFCDHLRVAVDTLAKGINLHLDHAHDVTPELVMNLLFHHSLEEGLDASQCAELYTVGVDAAGLAVVADSFAAMQTRVEEQKLLTWDALYAALDSDFAEERTRLILNSTPKYCGGNTCADAWAKRISAAFTRITKEQPMPQNRQLIPGLFSWAQTISFGKAVGATPNGRYAAEPISHGANPNAHFRTDGAVTALSTGVAGVQCGYGNTAPLQLEFDPQITMEEGGVERVVDLLKTHFALGGTLININILDGEKLMKAHEDPSLYPDLVVRVTGFTAYFATLSPEFRQLVVNRFLEGM